MTSDSVNIRKLFSIRFLSALLGVGGSIITIYSFGTRNNIEIWFLSSLIFNSFISLSQAGLISELIIPVYTAERKTNSEKASDIFSYLVNIVLFCSIFLVTIMYFNLSEILLLIFNDNMDIDFVRLNKFTSIINLLIPLSLVNIILKSVLNSHGIFGVPEKIKVVKQIITITSIVFLYKWGIVALALPFVIGIILEFCVLSIYIKKTSFKYNYKVIRKPQLNTNFAFNKNIGSTMLYVISTQVFTIYLTSVISGFNIIFYNSYTYVINLFKVLRNTTINSFKTVYLTSFSLDETRFHKIKKELNLMDFILGSLMIFIGVNSEAILMFLWKNENFGIDSIIKASYILKILSLGYIFDLLLFFMSMKIKIDLKFNKLLLIQSLVQICCVIILYVLAHNAVSYDKVYCIIFINFLLNSVFLYLGFDAIYKELVFAVRRIKVLLIILIFNLFVFMGSSAVNINIYDSRIILFIFLTVNFSVSSILTWFLYKYIDKRSL